MKKLALQNMTERDISNMQKEMQKVWRVGYNYATRDRALDRLTSFVFQVKTFKQLIDMCRHVFKNNNNEMAYTSYAVTRWYKLQAALFSEYVFHTACNVVPGTVEEDRKHIDFYLDGTPFDLKNTMLPLEWNSDLDYAIKHKKELAKWLLDHQANRDVSNYHNQLLLICASSQRPNWFLKAELFKTRRVIRKWLKKCNVNRMDIQLENGLTTKAEIIWMTE